MHRTARIGFHAYLRHRKYDYGRSHASSWRFIALALGDPQMPDAASWPELHTYLQAEKLPADLIEAARTVWRSYLRNAPRQFLSLSPLAANKGMLQPNHG